MRKFTVKDFITYNNPCFSCGGKIVFKIGFYGGGWHPTTPPSSLSPSIMPDYTEVNLKISYSDSISLLIFHKTNKILTNNQEGLVRYLSDHMLFLTSTCTACKTYIESRPLNFHLINDGQFVSAVELSNERLIVMTSNNTYTIDSSFPDQKSTLSVYKKDGSPPTVLKLPLLPRYKFKDRDHFLEKMKLYVTFS